MPAVHPALLAMTNIYLAFHAMLLNGTITIETFCHCGMQIGSPQSNHSLNVCTPHKYVKILCNGTTLATTAPRLPKKVLASEKYLLYFSRPLSCVAPARHTSRLVTLLLIARDPLTCSWGVRYVWSILGVLPVFAFKFIDWWFIFKFATLTVIWLSLGDVRASVLCTVPLKWPMSYGAINGG